MGLFHKDKQDENDAAKQPENLQETGTTEVKTETTAVEIEPTVAETELPAQSSQPVESVPVKRALERVKPSLSRGLTPDEVRARIEHGAVNTPVDASDVTLKDIVKENVFTYFNLIFLLIAIALCLVGSFRDLTFLPIIIFNTLIGIFQEWRSKSLLDKLNIMNAPKTTVIRGGARAQIASSDLVLDDLVIFEAGNQIPADAYVEEGELSVNESLLTGESDEIIKKPGDQLLSGSFVVSGTAKARIDKVGEDSYVSKLTLEAKARKHEEQSEMIRSLDRLVKMVGILIIPISVLLFCQQYLINHASIRDSVTQTVAAILGMIPEGLYLLASVAMAVSAMRLALGKVLVHNMKSIETLARVDVLCVDKTGTITENTMSVRETIPLVAVEEAEVKQAETASATAEEPETRAAGSGEPEADSQPKLDQSAQEDRNYRDEEETGVPAAESPENVSPDILEKIELAIGDFAASQAGDNITMKAVKSYYTKQTGHRADRVFPFSSVWKYSGAVFGKTQYVLGAPEFVLRSAFEDFRERIEKYSFMGFRVLVFGEYQGELDGGALTAAVKPLALILLANPVRKNAPETFKYFAKEGVQIKVISGDSPMTVSEVAMEAGIENADRFVDASTLLEEDMDEACEKFTVFGRVSPQQKRQLVAALKRAGHTVAMTGDGVNDVLALKDADCSIAMASGSDAAAHAAQMVLLESDFSKMPAVVTEGRRVVNNIERSASLFLVKNIFSLFMSLFSIIFTLNYPLEPSQISLISMFTIGFPAFFLSLETNHDRIKGHFLGNVFYKALPAGMTDFLVISALVIFCREFRVSGSDLSVSCTILLAIVGIMILYRIMSPMTKFHWGLWVAMIFGIVFCMLFLNRIFAITVISRRCTMLLVIFAIITEPMLRYLSLLAGKLRDLLRWILKKWEETRMAGI